MTHQVQTMRIAFQVSDLLFLQNSCTNTHHSSSAEEEGSGRGTEGGEEGEEGEGEEEKHSLWMVQIRTRARKSSRHSVGSWDC